MSSFEEPTPMHPCIPIQIYLRIIRCEGTLKRHTRYGDDRLRSCSSLISFRGYGELMFHSICFFLERLVNIQRGAEREDKGERQTEVRKIAMQGTHEVFC